MRKTRTQGFTLIELLIVIAIIGILAAVLIPNLMNARTTAAHRAAQAHSANLYTAAMAAIAEDTDADPTTVTIADCNAGGPIQIAPTGGAVADSNYEANAAPSQSTCTLAWDAGTNDVAATVVSTAGDGRTYLNGVDVTP